MGLPDLHFFFIEKSFSSFPSLMSIVATAFYFPLSENVFLETYGLLRMPFLDRLCMSVLLFDNIAIAKIY
jgi:hypothetical protein